MDILKERIVIRRTPKQESNKDNKTIKRMCKKDVSWRNLISNRDTKYVLEEDENYFLMVAYITREKSGLDV